MEESSLIGSLQKVFDLYSQGAGCMEGKSFAKISKDTKGLIDGKGVTNAEVDLAFAKAKRGERKVTFPEFLQALEILASKKGTSF